MRNINDKTKKWLTIAGLGIVCVALVISIAFQFKTKTPLNDAVAPTAITDNEVNLNPDTGDRAGEKEGSIQGNEPIDDTAAKTDQPVQNLQPEVTKPAAPTESQKTDKTQKPNGEQVDTMRPTKPQGGGKKDGKVYLPGFGWVTETGGSGTQVDGEGDINKQVGTMD